MSDRMYVRDDTAWERLRDRFFRFLRTRTMDQWLMFLAGALIGAILA